MFPVAAFAPPVCCGSAAGACVPHAIGQAYQGLISDMLLRLQGAEAALGREAVARQRAEGALAAERRKVSRLRGELRKAGRRADVAEERCRALKAMLASAAAPPRAQGDELDEHSAVSVPTPPAERLPPVEEQAPPAAEPAAELPPPAAEPAASGEPPGAESTEGQPAVAPPRSGGATLRERLRCWVQDVPIGGNPASTSRRTYNIECLACFAEANGLGQSEPEAIYRAFVDGRQKQADAEAAGGFSTAVGVAEGGQLDDELALRAPSPREGLPEAAGGTGRRLGMPLQPSRSDDSDWSMVDAPASPLPAGPPAGGAWGWLPHFPAAVGHVAAAAAGALAAAGR
eukprot:TRINITY_DN18605_c0_g2_i1.p1 TRINITY_DN18605_c0_g2~~TRINITY_DN18605_c0_g2_i1.p1  ORF type:complete len:367 (+),score=105.12 TRINITY_DN18605_c0_g2_i1:71-1102(+)